MPETAFHKLYARLFEVVDLNGVGFLLKWDQATYMPKGGAGARARQIALLKTLAHARLTDPAVGKLLDEAAREVQTLPPESFEASYVRVARRDFERAVRVPAGFTRAFFEHTAATYQAWIEARPANDFTRVEPLLEKTLELSRTKADFYAPYAHPADPLIAESDYGMTVATLRPLFTELREALVPLVRELAAREAPDDSFLRYPYPLEAQVAFAAARVGEFGYDFSRGRIDPTHHPFAIEFSIDDVRITTRGREDYLPEALFCTFHESGHGMYHQGLDAQLAGTPLADGTSAGVHESQSRLWENLVGRSLGFWRYAYPRLQATFPDQLGSVPVESFWRALNIVKPSLIRTRADEVTYNLHVLVRFELELELLEGRLAVRDLPDAWNAKYRDVLGVEVPNDADGVLQDVHWFSREIGGAFQGYTLGNLLSAQFFEVACETHPELLAQIERGEFHTLFRWFRENIHRHGRIYDPADLVHRVCGKGISLEPYLRYLKSKYQQVYA